MDRLLTQCEECLPLEGCTEYTVEAGRPDTITREKLAVLKAHRIGRISINPQTLEDHVLEAIGRKHSAGDIREACALARDVGFDCVNMDLIAGLPRDSFDGFVRSLEGVLAKEPENVTVHSGPEKGLHPDGAGRRTPQRGGGGPDAGLVPAGSHNGRLYPLLFIPAEIHVRLAGERGLGPTGGGEPV